jgi:hypothetical protein
MIPREIQCTYCGWKGMTGRGNSNTDDPNGRTFRYLGRNHYSGHLHYQCPACSVVLLVPPAKTLTGFLGVMPYAASPEYKFFVGEGHGLAAG